MKRLLSVAAATAAATAAFSGAATAETSVSGNVALTTDYVFRGISQTQDAPAIQGGFDFVYTANDKFSVYAGTWASNLDFGSAGPISVDVPLEIDLYGGIRPVVGPVTFDLGVIYYAYPGADDSLWASGEFDYAEVKAGASISPVEGLTVGGTLYYSPEFPGDGGDALYAEGTAAFAISDAFSVSGGVANQSVDLAGYFVTPTGGVDSYTTWNVGGTVSKWGFGLDVRYYDTDEDITNFVGEVVSDERVVATLKRTL